MDNTLPPRRRTLPDWARDLILLGLALLTALCGFRMYRDVLTFGFTPQYLSIAKTTIANRYYSDTLTLEEPATDEAAPSTAPSERAIIPEVQREPLYPGALIFARRILGSYRSLRYVQLLAMIASLWLWGRLSVTLFGWFSAACFYVFMVMDPIPGFYTSVLYPYSFQFFLISAGLYLLIQGMHSCTIWNWIGAGAALGLAAYERGAYLALPIFLALTLLCFARKIGISPRRLAVFLLVALLLPLPWLLRNHRLGTTGMNQMIGYSLGCAFGDLPSPARDSFKRGYDESVANNGRDDGTLHYIQQQVIAGNASFSEMDRRVAQYVLHKCKLHPARAFQRVQWNIIAFPYRLCDPSLEHLWMSDSIAHHYWRSSAAGLAPKDSAQFPEIADTVVVALALLGLTIMFWRHTGPAIVLTATLFYTLFFSTTIVIFDPRYRGPIDAALFIAASYSLDFFISRLLARIRS